MDFLETIIVVGALSNNALVAHYRTFIEYEKRTGVATRALSNNAPTTMVIVRTF